MVPSRSKQARLPRAPPAGLTSRGGVLVEETSPEELGPPLVAQPATPNRRVALEARQLPEVYSAAPAHRNGASAGVCARLPPLPRRRRRWRRWRRSRLFQEGPVSDEMSRSCERHLRGARSHEGGEDVIYRQLRMPVGLLTTSHCPESQVNRTSKVAGQLDLPTSRFKGGEGRASGKCVLGTARLLKMPTKRC